ncbi:hypothetical protein [Rubritalea sp.]|uniref:hypothetical protein n=1 Tax=Rubritalea sp. TaxID=2109375 RepID=UPI003EF3F531
MKYITPCILCTSLLVGLSANADILVGYDFDDGTGVGTLAAAFVCPDVIATDFDTGPGLENSVYTSFAPVDGLDADGNIFGSTNSFSFGGTVSTFGFTGMNDADDLTGSISADDYMAFTVTPDAYSALNLSSLTFRTFVKQLNNAADRWALFSSIDGFAEGDEIATGQTTDILSWDESNNNVVVSLSDARFQHLGEAVEFRLYVYGGNQDSNSATAFDKVVLNGTTTSARLLYKDTFEGDGLTNNSGIGGGAVNRTINANAWVDDGVATFVTNAAGAGTRALLYSANSFQSDTGLKLSVNYTAGSIGDTGANSLAFGLISTDTELATFSGDNPFRADTSVYSIGANVTAFGGTTSRGLNFTNGVTRTTLDQSGTRAQFNAGEPCEVTLEIGTGGYWCYRIDGEYEASGALAEGFDLSKDYHVVVYGQDDNGGEKSIQSIKLEKRYAQGERAADLRGSWNGGQGDVQNIKHLRTIGSTIARLNEGASGSGNHNAPHQLLESIALGLTAVGGDPISAPVPSWGDLSLDEAQNDSFLAEILEIRNAGIGVKVYSNSENFVGSNTVALEAFFERWKEYCDTDPDVMEFIDSQPYHTGIWNSTTQEYEDASETYPNRKYMFCYAEYVLKNYALRYGEYVDSWTFDSANDMGANGDNASSGILEQQRIFQAFANAVHAGNPEIPIAFNNGRSNVNYGSYPYVAATRFDDFTFGHAFGGNNNHAEGTQFTLNYQHITRMTETNGYVHAESGRDWDNLIVGNFHSKLGPISWQYSTPSAWEQDDFNQWNLEAMQAGGHTTWEGSVSRGPRTLRDWAITQLELLDAHLAEFQNPGPPSWARKYTWLPEATIGETYYHVLVEGADFWDPESDDITSLVALGNTPDWLTIQEDPNDPTRWILSGMPTAGDSATHAFSLKATEAHGFSCSREVELVVNESPYTFANGLVYQFEMPTSISGTTSEIVYTAPDVNTFGDGVTVSNLMISDGDNPDTYYGRIEDIGGGSLEAAVSDREAANTIDFTLNVSDKVIIGLSNISFDTSYFTSATGTSIMDWTFETIIGSTTSNTTTGGFSHNGGTNYQSPEAASGDIELTGLSGLTDTSVTFRWTLNGDKSNTFEIRSMGLDNIVLTGVIESQDLGPLATWLSDYGVSGDDASIDADTLDRDGYSILLEFALGMDPTRSDAGSKESIFTEEEDDSMYFVYEYDRRTDYLELGLNYTLIVKPDLLTPSDEAPYDIEVGDPLDDYETVKARFQMIDSKKFIQLQVELAE